MSPYPAAVSTGPADAYRVEAYRAGTPTGPRRSGAVAAEDNRAVLATRPPLPPEIADIVVAADLVTAVIAEPPLQRHIVQPVPPPLFLAPA